MLPKGLDESDYVPTIMISMGEALFLTKSLSCVRPPSKLLAKLLSFLGYHGSKFSVKNP